MIGLGFGGVQLATPYGTLTNYYSSPACFSGKSIYCILVKININSGEFIRVRAIEQ